MTELLKRLKLIDSLTTTLQTSKVEFVNRLIEITDKGDTRMISDTFDVFSSSKNEFRGQVDFEGFKIKRKRKFFDTNMNFAVATGTFSEKNGQLTIHTVITGFNDFFIVFYVFLIIFYSLFLFDFWSSDNEGKFNVILFILFHGTLMFGLPYIVMRRSIKRLKYELEREFFYLTKSK